MTTLTNRQAEGLLGLTTKRLQQLAAVGELPAQVDGQWPFPGVVTSLLKYYRDGKNSKEIEAARLAKIIAETELINQRLAAERGLLMPVEDVVTLGAKLVVALRAAVIAAPLDADTRDQCLKHLQGAVLSVPKTGAET